MAVMDNEDPADPSAHEPRVTGAPAAVWLVYGDIESDATHRECCDSGEVTWCEDAQFPADVRYTRTDLVAERVRAAVAAERERCAKVADEHARRTFTWGSENSDLYHAQADWAEAIAKSIRQLKA